MQRRDTYDNQGEESVLCRHVRSLRSAQKRPRGARKALDLVGLSESTGIRAGVVFKDATGWCVVVGKDDVESLVFSPAREYFTLGDKKWRLLQAVLA